MKKIQFSNRRIEGGGIKHVIYHPHWHWLYNSMIANSFFLSHKIK